MRLRTTKLKEAARFKAALENHGVTATDLCGITYAQYVAEVDPVLKLWEEKQRLSQAAQAKAQEVVNALPRVVEANRRLKDAARCSPLHGSNSPLWADLGFVPDNQRKSGLHRGSSPLPEMPPVTPVVPPQTPPIPPLSVAV